MGRTYADLVVRNPNKEDDPQTIRNVLVDTGSTHTVLPAATLEAMGIKPVRQVPVRIADNSVMDVWLGYADISLAGRPPLPCAVFFWPTEKYLIGRTTLENHGLKVNPTTEHLETAEYELYYYSRTCSQDDALGLQIDPVSSRTEV